MQSSPRWRTAASLVSIAVTALALTAVSARAGQNTPRTGDVTFSKDIAPILQRSCQNCHRPDSIAPMSLLTYEEVRPWARAMKLRTSLRNKPETMPPWFIEKNVGIQQYKGDFSLSDAEIEKIAKWADSGAPRGNPADEPPPLKFLGANEWQIGKPDLVVSGPTVEVKATAPDWWGPLKMVESGLTEDRYVAAIEMKEVNENPTSAKSGRQTIGGRSVVHHLIWSVIDGDGRAPGVEASQGWPIHEVGRNADFLDPETGRLMKAGSKLVFPSVHLHASGADTKAHVEFGFKFFPKDYQPKYRIRTADTIGTLELDIRPMEANQKLEAYRTLTENTKIVAYEPHMHAAGVRMCMDAIWGTTVQTLSCAGYNHGWVRIYTYADDAAPLLPKGTILRITGYFDNTPANKNVVDPRNWSGLGHRSIDNMMINIGQTITLTDEQFQEEMNKRRQKLQLTEGQSVLGCPLCGYTKPVGVKATSQQQQQQ
jgi:hypothetical protein